MRDLTQELSDFQAYSMDDPVWGIETLFGVEVTEQQKSLILPAWDPYARVAVSSCTGAGKTAALCWLMYLFLLTQPDCRVLISSPSFSQLRRVFHSELLKWYKKMPKHFADLFTITKEHVEIKAGRWVQSATLQTASAENTESLQGGHAENYVILLDEASGCSDIAFDALMGTLSTGSGGRFVLTSNPVKSSGKFFEIFSREMEGWERLTFEAFDCPHTSKEWIESIRLMYGEDSDQWRVRVLGKFPRVTDNQFIPTPVAQEALDRYIQPSNYYNFPLVIGCDVARFGSDETVFIARKGPKILDIQRYSGKDTMEVAGLLYEYWLHQGGGTTPIYIDAIGIGAGVFDRCKQLKMPVISVQGSLKSTRPLEFWNLRSQLWGAMRTWLGNDADIPNIPELYEQLVGMTYGYTRLMQISLTSKKDMKRSGLKSPDIADALALTFAGDALQSVHYSVGSSSGEIPVVDDDFFFV